MKKGSYANRIFETNNRKKSIIGTAFSFSFDINFKNKH